MSVHGHTVREPFPSLLPRQPDCKHRKLVAAGGEFRGECGRGPRNAVVRGQEAVGKERDSEQRAASETGTGGPLRSGLARQWLMSFRRLPTYRTREDKAPSAPQENRQAPSNPKVGRPVSNSAREDSPGRVGVPEGSDRSRTLPRDRDGGSCGPPLPMDSRRRKCRTGNRGTSLSLPATVLSGNP